MYSRQQAAERKRDFWTRFGQYLRPVPSAWQERAHWANYKTGVKGVFFRLDAGRKQASVSVEIAHPDDLERRRIYMQFEALRKLFEQEIGGEWDWMPEATDEHGQPVSLIRSAQQDVDVLDMNTWPAIMSFLKPRIIALDRFWADVRDAFTE